MGGKAFGHGPNPLSTPRIPQATYILLRDQCIRGLSKFYTHVASPIDAPEKDSHGDVDILVSGPVDGVTRQVISQALNAKASIATLGSPSTSFAIPFPGSPNDFVQLDVHVCPPDGLRWELFTNSHGDLWNILGTSIRAFGLTANNVGLYLRIEEIEKFDRKRSMLCLTSDPSSVLDFLGLDAERYWRPFETVDQLCLYATSMRLFKREAYVRDILKSSDRKRMVQRPLYRRFVDEWLPLRPELKRNPSVTRERILSEGLERYKRTEEYKDMLRVWHEERAELESKWQAKESRRTDAKAEMAYADAWIQMATGAVQEEFEV